MRNTSGSRGFFKAKVGHYRGNHYVAGRWPSRCSRRAAISSIASPSMMRPERSHEEWRGRHRRRRRHPHPRFVRPLSPLEFFRDATAPQSRLILRPSARLQMAVTSAPACRNSPGASGGCGPVTAIEHHVQPRRSATEGARAESSDNGSTLAGLSGRRRSPGLLDFASEAIRKISSSISCSSASGSLKPVRAKTLMPLSQKDYARPKS